MQQSRRAYLRGAGALALGVGLAGCSSGNDSSGDSGGGSQENGGGSDGSGSGSKSGSGSTSASETSGSEAAAASGDGGGSSATPGKDAAATGLSGTVADKSAQGLSFVEQSHYSMNGAQGVTGRIKNTSDSAFQEVTLHVTVQPGDAGPYTETLEGGPLKPGETRRFKFGFGDGAPDEVQGYTIWATTGQQG